MKISYLKHILISSFLLLNVCLMQHSLAGTATFSAAQYTGLDINTSHATSQSAQNFGVLHISDNLNNQCQDGFFINANTSHSTYALVLSAVLSKETMTIVYDEGQRSPWGDQNLCEIRLVRVHI